MKERNFTFGNQCLAELTIRLRQESFIVLPPEDDLLPVEWNGHPLCRITSGGSIRYRQEDMLDLDTELACNRATDITATTAEYMKLMEKAPILKADSLDETYKLLADFNCAVLAGHPTDCHLGVELWRDQPVARPLLW